MTNDSEVNPTTTAPTGRPRIDATQGPLLGAIVSLAWPTLVALSLRVAFNIVGIFWVARLGTAAVAALGTSSFFYWMLLATTDTIAVGTLALVAREIGARRVANANRIASQGLAWAAILGILVMGIGLIAIAPGFAWMGVSEEVRTLGVHYMTLILLGTPFLFVFTAADSILRARGEPRTSLGILGGTLLLNAVLDPLFIFGWGPLPAWGVRGAAFATSLSFAIGAIAAARAVTTGDDPGRSRWPVVPNAKDLRRIVAIGLPSASAGVLFALVYVMLTTTTSRFGDAALAALGIGHKLESPAYLISVALASATATAVGQCLGAELDHRAHQGAMLATKLAIAVAAVMTACLVFFPEPLVRVFSQDPAVIAMGSAYLRIAGYVQIPQAIEITLGGVFAGAGNTVPPMLIRISLTLIRIPLAAWMAIGLGFGVDGVFWAIAISAGLKGIAMAYWFRRGRWQTGKLAN